MKKFRTWRDLRIDEVEVLRETALRDWQEMSQP